MCCFPVAPKFYDHALNFANPAVASAVARARQSAIEAGEAYRVTFVGARGVTYWNGCFHDALGLAKSLAASPCHGAWTDEMRSRFELSGVRPEQALTVWMTCPAGTLVNIRDARF